MASIGLPRFRDGGAAPGGARREHAGAREDCARADLRPRASVKRKSYRVGPKDSSWPKILAVNPY